MASARRSFTREQDRLIVAFSRGQISMEDLAHKIHSTPPTIERRAGELGLCLDPAVTADVPQNPYRIADNDPLLMRLREVYGVERMDGDVHSLGTMRALRCLHQRAL